MARKKKPPKKKPSKRQASKRRGSAQHKATSTKRTIPIAGPYVGDDRTEGHIEGGTITPPS